MQKGFEQSLAPFLSFQPGALNFTMRHHSSYKCIRYIGGAGGGGWQGGGDNVI